MMPDRVWLTCIGNRGLQKPCVRGQLAKSPGYPELIVHGRGRGEVRREGGCPASPINDRAPARVGGASSTCARVGN
jgi:hypothetical protein